jgi:hypothetical protein
LGGHLQARVLAAGDGWDKLLKGASEWPGVTSSRFQLPSPVCLAKISVGRT